MRRINRWATKTTAVIGVAVVAMTAFGPAAAAAAGDRSAAEARFLSGSAGGNDFDQVAALEGAEAKRSGETNSDKEANALSGRILGQALPEQPDGLTVPLDDLVTLGAVNQYAEATARAQARAASGAVADSGAINTRPSKDFPANVDFSLTKLLATEGIPEELAKQIELDLNVGAISSTAEFDALKDQKLASTCSSLANPKQCRDYNIAGLDLTLKVAPLAVLLDQLAPVLQGADFNELCDADPVADGLEPLCDLISSPTNPVQVELKQPDFSKVLKKVANPDSVDGVSVDFRSGTVKVDLEEVLKAAGLDLNNLEPNKHELVSYIAQALADNLPDLLAATITDLTDELQKEFTDSGVILTLAGTGIRLTAEQARPVIDQIKAQLTPALEEGADDLSDSLKPLTDQLGQLAQLIAIYPNVQDEPSAGVFRVTALKVQLLKAAGGTPLALPGGGASVAAADPEAGIVLNLARSQVSAGVGETPAAAAATPIKNGPNLPNTGASTMDLPLLLLGLGLVSAGMWIIMYGRSGSLES